MNIEIFLNIPLFLRGHNIHIKVVMAAARKFIVPDERFFHRNPSGPPL